MGGGGKGGTTTQTVTIPPEVMARYSAVNARAEEVAKQPFQQYGGQFVANLTPTQQAGIQATNESSQLAQPYFGAGAGLTLGGAQAVGPLTRGQIGYYESPYTESVAAPTYQALRQQQGQELAQQQANAIRAGAFGGSRSGIERANLMRQQNLATAQALAPIYQQGYQQAVQTAMGQQGVVASDLARQMQAGQQIAGLGTGAQQAALQGAQAQIGAGTLEQQTQQADLTARYQQFLQERGYPFQVAQFLANIAMGTGALSGSTTTTQQPSGFFSDRRLKHDVERIGQTDDGLPIYSYKYNGDDKTQIGLMAQDVERVKPEAVGLAPAADGNLYKTVDYEKATESEGGGVVPSRAGEGFYRGGYAVGGGGGLISDSTDLNAILKAQQQMFGPFGGAGLYGQESGGSPMGGKSYVPKAALPTPKLVTAGPAPRQAPSGAEQALGAAKAVSGAWETGKGLKQAGTDIKEWWNKPTAEGSATGYTKDAATSTTAPAKVADASPAPAEAGLKVAEADIPKPDDFSEFGNLLAKRGGLIVGRNGYVSGGSPGAMKTINPYESKDLSEGYIDDTLENQDGSKNPTLLKADGAGGGGAGGGGILGAAKDAAGLYTAGKGLYSMGTALFSMLSDERLKDNIRPVGLTYDGQNIYAYDMGDGKTQLGLMAQEVLERKPEAVGMNDNGYLMLNYDKATESAVPRASGGLVPRRGYLEGGEALVEEMPAMPERAPEAPPQAGLAIRDALRSEQPDYRNIVTEAAKKHGIDVDHAIRLAQGESGMRPISGDEGSSGSIFQLHVGGLSRRYPNSGLGDVYFQERHPELAKTFTPAQKIAFLNDPTNQADIADFSSQYIAQKGASPWTVARNQGLFGLGGARAYAPTSDEGRGLAVPRPPQDIPPRREERAPITYDNVPARQAGLGDIGSSLLPEGVPTTGKFWVPTLSFLGAMLASRNPSFGGALGEGVLGGVAGYQAQQKYEIETARDLRTMMNERFVPDIFPNEPEYGDRAGKPAMFDTKTLRYMSPQEYSAIAFNMAKEAQVSPRLLGISMPEPPKAPRAPLEAQAERQQQPAQLPPPAAKPDEQPPAAQPPATTAQAQPPAAAPAAQPTSGGLVPAKPIPAEQAIESPPISKQMLIDEFRRGGDEAYRRAGLDKGSDDVRKLERQYEETSGLADRLEDLPAKVYGQRAQQARLRANQLREQINALYDKAVDLPYRMMEANRTENNKWFGERADEANARIAAQQSIRNMKDLLNLYRTGAFSTKINEFATKLRALGVDEKVLNSVVDASRNKPEAMQRFAKEAMISVFENIKQIGGQIRVAEMVGQQKANPDPDVEPGTNRSIISQMEANLLIQDKFFNDAVEARAKNPYQFDRSKFTSQWIKDNANFIRETKDKLYDDFAVIGDVPLKDKKFDATEAKIGRSYIIEPGMGIGQVDETGKPMKLQYLGKTEDGFPIMKRVRQ